MEKDLIAKTYNSIQAIIIVLYHISSPGNKEEKTPWPKRHTVENEEKPKQDLLPAIPGLSGGCGNVHVVGLIK